MEDSKARFDAGAGAWGDYNRKPVGRMRREITWHNLAPYLPAALTLEPPPRILDGGGGSGELALSLTRQGYHVWLLDYAPAMLDQARQAARALPREARARLTLCPMAPEERAFADYVPRERLGDPEFYSALLRLEMSASALAPFKSMARYGHLIAHKVAHRRPS